ncbi:hypothetical protein [Streptomyces collinus]|uniref:hypothetical protein n=1 Tax=Streptomyces collinus TaxID=42684 RepID=UPI0036320863
MTQPSEEAREVSTDVPGGVPSEEPRYEAAPGVGKLALWILLFAVAALAVVLGGVYFT